MKCPGQDSRYWKPEAIFEEQCPKCGHAVEFFKDDTARKCSRCGHRFINPKMDFGCASYCEFAEQCMGTLPPELLAEKEDLLKDRVAIEMKRHFKSDFKRIGHAVRVARYAERIGKMEAGNLAVILCAAYLHDIGINDAEPTSGGTSTRHLEQEGPPIARRILEKLGAKEPLIAEVCDILRHRHRPGADESVNFKVVYDADLITGLEETYKEKPKDEEELATSIANDLLTESGRTEAKKVLGITE